MKLSPRKKPPGNRCAFTVIELLIAVAVIAIVAVLLVSGMGTLRGKADAVRCVSNLRQIGMLLNGYAAEHRGYYPREAYAEGYKGGGIYWAPEHFMLDYKGFRKGEDGRIIQNAPPEAESIFRCPGEKSLVDLQGNPWFQSHYGFNRYLVHFIASDFAPGLYGTNPCRRPISSIPNPSQVFLAGDSRSRYSISHESGGTRTLAFRHGSTDTCNIVFVDGHVETLPASARDVLGGPAALGWAQYIEWGGTYHAPGSPRY